METRERMQAGSIPDSAMPGQRLIWTFVVFAAANENKQLYGGKHEKH